MSTPTILDVRRGEAHNVRMEPREVVSTLVQSGDGYAVDVVVRDPRTGEVLGTDRVPVSPSDPRSGLAAVEWKHGVDPRSSQSLLSEVVFDEGATLDVRATAAPGADAPPAPEQRAVDPGATPPAPAPVDRAAAGPEGAPENASEFGGVLDRQVDRALDSVRGHLDTFVQDRGSWWAVGLATAADTALTLGGDSVKDAWGLLHLGKGSAEGGWLGYGQDAMLLAGAIVPGASLVKRLGKSVRRAAGLLDSVPRGKGTMASVLEQAGRRDKWSLKMDPTGSRIVPWEHRITAKKLLDDEPAPWLKKAKTRLNRFEHLSRLYGFDRNLEVARRLRQAKGTGHVFTPQWLLGPRIRGDFDALSGHIRISENASIRSYLDTLAHERHHLGTARESLAATGRRGADGERYARDAWYRWGEEARAEVAGTMETAFLKSPAVLEARLRRSVSTFPAQYLEDAAERAHVAKVLAEGGGIHQYTILVGEGVDPALAFRIAFR